MSRPTAGCIIPTYNTAHYLGEAIESALAQTVPFEQIIVVDDGSTDETDAVLKRYSGRIDVVRQKNMGVSAARNAGVGAITTDLIAFLDADDRYLPDKLARQRAALEGMTGFCDGATRYFWSEELPEDVLRADHRRAHDFWRKLHAGHISSWLVSRDLMDRVGPFEVGRHFSEDSDWLMRCRALDIHRIRLEDVLGERRLHLTNITRRNRAAQIDGLFHAIRRKRQRAGGR